MKVLTFSRTFPAYHPKAGQPTFFVEKLWQSIYIQMFEDCTREEFDFSPLYNVGIDIYAHDKYPPKHHTIRAGNRWKVGDKFSPRVWSGKPYQSKQIIIAPDIEIKKVWDFHIAEVEDNYGVKCQVQTINTNSVGEFELFKIAKNDGLELQDMLHWFKYPKPFTGQIICWNDSINY